MSCKGICDRLKADCPEDGLRYANGQKRCGHCKVYLFWESRSCPCCGIPLRTKSRLKKSNNTTYRF